MAESLQSRFFLSISEASQWFFSRLMIIGDVYKTEMGNEDKLKARRNDTLAPKSFWAGEHLEAEFVNFVVSRGRSHRNLLPVHIRGQWAGLLERVFPNTPAQRPYFISRHFHRYLTNTLK